MDRGARLHHTAYHEAACGAGRTSMISASSAAAADVVWLDGRREHVERVVVKGDRLLLSFEKGMRSIATRRVVQVVGDDGEEIALDRALRDGALEAEDAAALASLPTADGTTLREIQERLADSMSGAVMDRSRRGTGPSGRSGSRRRRPPCGR